jgi:[protein-PII] uridylyltransferase
MRAPSIAAPSCSWSTFPPPSASTSSSANAARPSPAPTSRSTRAASTSAPEAQFSQSTDTDGLLRVFALIANHGYTLTQAAEDRITDALPVLAIHIPEGPYLWNHLREVLLGPHAAHALRTMHALGILEMLIPEFHGIDALVIRDSYHRYTVDEHTFLTIDNVQALRRPLEDYEKRLATLLPEIDRLDLLLLSLLLHDTGKGRRNGEHTAQSVELADSFLARLDFDIEEREIVRKLIRSHLEMSNALRRDIFDTENVHTLSEKSARRSCSRCSR